MQTNDKLKWWINLYRIWYEWHLIIVISVKVSNAHAKIRVIFSYCKSGRAGDTLPTDRFRDKQFVSVTIFNMANVNFSQKDTGTLNLRVPVIYVLPRYKFWYYRVATEVYTIKKLGSFRNKGSTRKFIHDSSNFAVLFFPARDCESRYPRMLDSANKFQTKLILIGSTDSA